MRRLGVIGGIGPESTIAYYQALLAIAAELGTDGNPPILIDSLDVRRLLRLMSAGRLTEVEDYLVAEIEVLARGGAALAIIAANTPHIVFDQVSARSPIPLLSIVEAARDAARTVGLKRVGLLGTRFTMQARFYTDVLANAAIDTVVPTPEEQGWVHDCYVNELLSSILTAPSRERMLELIATMKERDRTDGILLAGTELPLLLPMREASGIPLLDTTQIHARAAATAAWASS
jgi:aspartate racemase